MAIIIIFSCLDAYKLQYMLNIFLFDFKNSLFFHLDINRAERAAYPLMRERAQREPDLYTVMIVAGIDQIKNTEQRILNILLILFSG